MSNPYPQHRAQGEAQAGRKTAPDSFYCLELSIRSALVDGRINKEQAAEHFQALDATLEDPDFWPDCPPFLSDMDRRRARSARPV